MGKKVKIRISEQDLSTILARNLFGGEGEDILGNILKNIKKTGTPSNVQSAYNTAGEFPQLDLNKPEDYKVYQEIADRFISTRPSNLLGIRGSMLADAAKNSQRKFGKYVPVELALAQLAIEGGFSNNPNARPIKTKNPFNVGNVDSGKNVFQSSVQSGIQSYYDLMAKNYLTQGKTATDLLKNFVNRSGNRYATARNYESKLSQVANKVQSLGQPIYAKLNKKTGSDIA